MTKNLRLVDSMHQRLELNFEAEIKPDQGAYDTNGMKLESNRTHLTKKQDMCVTCEPAEVERSPRVPY